MEPNWIGRPLSSLGVQQQLRLEHRAGCSIPGPRTTEGSNFARPSSTPMPASASPMARSSARPSSPSAEPPITSAILSRVSPRPAAPAPVKASTASMPLAFRPAPLVKVAALVLAPFAEQEPHAVRPQAVPACPPARSTASFCPSLDTPAVVKRPFRSFLLLIFTTAEPRGRPAASSPSTAIAMISASASGRAEPTMSASHCTNSRKRPGPGFSLRHTGP